MSNDRVAAILVTTYPGSPSVDALEAAAASGERPRKDYVELARALPSVVVDDAYMRTRATPYARAIAARFGLAAGQIAEAYARRTQFGSILAWADRLGLPLASLFKLTRSRRDLVLVSVLLSNPKKAVFLSRLNVHSHLGALVTYSTAQATIAVDDLGVPREKVRGVLPAIDERFWSPRPEPPEDLICSVGLEARDYGTLFKALEQVNVPAEVELGNIGVPAWVSADATVPPPPPSVTVRRGSVPRELRRLYARSRFVVVSVEDVEFEAGGTVISEAMAMGKAVIATRSRGQTDLIRHGENGLYVRPRDPRELREAIEHLLANPGEAERLGRRARALVEQRQTLDGHVRYLAELLHGP